jgi:hypothetical protein
MNYLTNPTASTIRRTGPWLEFATDAYLDHRHRNWLLAEELGDVIFVAARDVVLVHRERAEHIARALGGGPDVAQLDLVPLPASTPPEPARLPAPRPVRQATESKPPVVIGRTSSRWRHACGWLGIAAGAAILVAALALPLDDPALVVALMLEVRGGRPILDVDS